MTWNRKSIHRAPEGFTLLELMAVIIILGILAVFVAPRLTDAPSRAKVSKAKVELQALDTSLNMYRMDMGRYPSTEEGLDALVTAPQGTDKAGSWRKGGYVEKGKIPKDPWGNEYVYIYPGNQNAYDLLTYGEDGQPGGEDYNADINVWDIE